MNKELKIDASVSKSGPLRCAHCWAICPGAAADVRAEDGGASARCILPFGLYGGGNVTKTSHSPCVAMVPLSGASGYRLLETSLVTASQEVFKKCVDVALRDLV